MNKKIKKINLKQFFEPDKDSKEIAIQSLGYLEVILNEIIDHINEQEESKAPHVGDTDVFNNPYTNSLIETTYPKIEKESDLEDFKNKLNKIFDDATLDDEYFVIPYIKADILKEVEKLLNKEKK